MNDKTEILEAAPAPRPASRSRAVAAAPATPADLLRIAVEGGADLDKLERLMALQVDWEQRQAKRRYDEAFAAFKSEAVRIQKNQTVLDGPLRGKRFAQLFVVVDAVTPALSKHGLSSSWKITKDEKDWIEVTCYLRHVDGHQEAVSLGGPPDTGGAKNAIQARASTVSYLERYTLKAILGLSEREDDDDGRAGGPSQDADDPLLAAWQAASLEGHEALKAAYFAAQDDAALWSLKGDRLWAKHGASLKDAATKADADAKASKA